jgi:vitamin B12 transporter
MNKRIMLLSILAAAVYLLVPNSPAFALSTDEKGYLSLYFQDDELTVESATRSPQPVSRTADNMTVVTAADIERMNAHTLADVLNTIPGVEVWMTGGPGQAAQVTILGSNERHVTVIIDGIVINSLWSGVSDVGQIPVQNIEKIEIIKGPASSAWGSALGGVINIITKSGRSIDQGGVVYGSFGQGGFEDVRAEVRGKQDRLGYYVMAGMLHSDELTPHVGTTEYTGYTKLTYDMGEKSVVLFTLSYGTLRRGDFYNYYWPDPTWAGEGSDNSHHVRSTLEFNSSLSKDLDLSLLVWSNYHSENDNYVYLPDSQTIYKDVNKGYGSSAKLIWKNVPLWKGAQQTVVFGIDTSDMTDKFNVLPNGQQGINKWAVYANDTVAFNRFTMTPGVRYDHTDSNGDITSPSLGLTYGLGNSTVLRAYAARGFSEPKTGDTFGFINGWLGNPNIKMETVNSYQAGLETASLNYVWLKLSLFKNDIHNLIQPVVLPSGDVQNQNIGHEKREGMLIEARTKPVYNTSLSAGAEFNTATDLSTGMTIPYVPTQVYDIGVRYDDHQSFKAQLLGRHINWNTKTADQSRYDWMIVDLNVIKKMYQRKNSSLEIFAAGHNLLNGTQYLFIYPNPSRWFEAGARYVF